MAKMIDRARLRKLARRALEPDLPVLWQVMCEEAGYAGRDAAAKRLLIAEFRRLIAAQARLVRLEYVGYDDHTRMGIHIVLRAQVKRIHEFLDARASEIPKE